MSFSHCHDCCKTIVVLYPISNCVSNDRPVSHLTHTHTHAHTHTHTHTHNLCFKKPYSAHRVFPVDGLCAILLHCICWHSIVSIMVGVTIASCIFHVSVLRLSRCVCEKYGAGDKAKLSPIVHQMTNPSHTHTHTHTHTHHN